MSPAARPTDAELGILQVLWASGPCTVREVQDGLGGESVSGYTTVLKLMQIMHDKGLVERDESARAHVYSAAGSRDDTQRGLVGDLVDRAFSGSAETLVMRALESRRSSPEELERIRKLLDQLESD
ncbi:MAG: BlaI/MecI/CopY family transcriptional regulator [Acidobacteria bacterium]|nr:BlaI/MecI/CopY family transcriptional regulator [Acidobacteriota bacterium]